MQLGQSLTTFTTANADQSDVGCRIKNLPQFHDAMMPCKEGSEHSFTRKLACAAAAGVSAGAPRLACAKAVSNSWHERRLGMDLHPETQLQMSMCRLREIPQADQQFQSSVYHLCRRLL